MGNPICATIAGKMTIPVGQFREGLLTVSIADSIVLAFETICSAGEVVNVTITFCNDLPCA
jgi:hypothetical protein